MSGLPRSAPEYSGGRDDDRDGVRKRLDDAFSTLRRASVRWPASILDRRARGMAGVRIAARLSRELLDGFDPDGPEADGPTLRVALRLAETAAEYLDGAADDHDLPRFDQPSRGGR